MNRVPAVLSHRGERAPRVVFARQKTHEALWRATLYLGVALGEYRVLAYEPYLAVAALAALALLPALLRAHADHLIHARLATASVITAGAGVVVLLVAQAAIAPPWPETGRFLAGIVTGMVIGLLSSAAAILVVDRRHRSPRRVDR